MKMKKQYEMKELDGSNGAIYLGIPRERVYIPKFVDNRDAVLAVLQDSGRAVGYWQQEGHRVDRNRDRISEAFMDHPKKPDWLLMLDTDMEHPVDCGIRLTKWNQPIVGALYFHRGDVHDPFVFDYDGEREDKYGRMTRRWIPRREQVYEFLQAHNIPMRDSSVVLDKPLMNPLVECDAVATGCIVIHRSVFEALERPYWEYRPLGNSEDLTFCYEAKEIGVPVHADLSTICGHYNWVPMGHAQFRQRYLAYGLNSTQYSKANAVRWLTEFLDIDEEDARAKIESGNAHLVGDYWRAQYDDKIMPPAEEVRAFYKQPYVGQLYLIELLHWNFSQAFHSIRQMIMPVRNSTVLEIGGGIGTVAMQLALQLNDVVTVEVNELLRNFTAYRWKDLMGQTTRGFGAIDIMDGDWTKHVKDEQFDMIVSFDTFEHIPGEDLQEMLKVLYRVVKVGGKLIYHNNFSQQDIYPLHYDHSEMWDTWLIEAGFIPSTPNEAIRIK
jgi:SAM-dependent methyltransferase